MNDKRYFDVILKTEIANAIQLLQVFKEYKTQHLEAEFDSYLETYIKEKVTALINNRDNL